MKELITYIERFQPLDAETKTAVENAFREERLKRNDFLAEEGKVTSKIYFIKFGLARRFRLSDGEDITTWLYHDEHWITSIASYFSQLPSKEYIQACEDTSVFSITYTAEQELLKYPLFLKFHTTFLRCSIAAFDDFHFTFGPLSSQGKYLYLMDKFPLIIQRAKQKYIASLLNVSQETLSRIRSSII
ncbi:Crp/Fnr family transcriptional regulator [Chryseolinea sp. T2]|uniref:Crp/Fnr family transcriptional regulator n=1 Tax=Chryseolinea sp. T2 TaxID=3129255 RepID=UPI0030787835